MKKITIYILLFILIFVVLDTVLSHALAYLWHRTDFIYNGVIAQESDILFFGDSKCRHGIVPEIVHAETGITAYNIARYGSGIIYSKGIQDLILSYYHPKLFVIQYMPLTTERGAIYSLAPYFDNKKVCDILSYYPFLVRLKYSLTKTLRYNSLLLTIFYRLFAEYDTAFGYVPLYGVSEIDKTERADGLGSDQEKLSEWLGECFLIKFIEDAKEKNGAKVIILIMPTLKERDMASYPVYKKVALRYGVPILDFSKEENLRIGLSRDFFWDVNHLNNKGAVKFTQVLAAEIAKIIGDS